jgi:hypothetical protein
MSAPQISCAAAVERKEPLTVTMLRQHIRRGAIPSVLFRIAGSEAEFRRLANDYGLRRVGMPVTMPPRSSQPLPRLDVRPKQAVVPVETLPDRQRALVELIEETAQRRDVFPPILSIADRMEVSWLVIESDLGKLCRKNIIRIETYRADGHAVRRIELVGRGLATALPPRSERLKPGVGGR